MLCDCLFMCMFKVLGCETSYCVEMFLYDKKYYCQDIYILYLDNFCNTVKEWFQAYKEKDIPKSAIGVFVNMYYFYINKNYFRNICILLNY